MKTKYLLLISFFIVSLTANAQFLQWQNLYNGTNNSDDAALSTVTDNSGNVFVAGYSNSGTNQDVTVHKYSPAGALLWTKTYNGTANGHDQGLKAVLDNSGNVYVTGYAYGSGTGNDMVTMKISSGGTILWTQIYNGTLNANDIAYDIKTDASSNVYITGYSTNSSTGIDFTTIKYNTGGVMQWLQKYNNSSANSTDIARALVLDQSGNVYVTGSSRGTSALGTEDYATIKHNSDGVIQWVQRYNPHGTQDFPAGIAVDQSGNIVICGHSLVNGFTNFIIFKYNPGGTVLWYNSYTGTADGNDYASAIVIDAANYIYIAGTTIDAGMGGTNITVLRYSSGGGLQWSRRYNGPGNAKDTSTSIAVDAGYNVYVAGGSFGLGTNLDATVIKYNSSGTQQWVQRINGFGNNNDILNSIYVDNGYNIYLAGALHSGVNLYDMAAIKYAQILIGIQNPAGEIPENFSLYQNYPNPFNPVTKIGFDVPVTSDIKLIIYDNLGREVGVLVNSQLNPGSYEINFDGTKYSSGVYYYKLITRDYTYIRKMMLVK